MSQFADGTGLTGEVKMPDGKVVGAEVEMDPVSDEFYYITHYKCTECIGFHEEPQCAAVCPVDCCVPDPEHEESDDELMHKKEWMHLE